MCVGPVICFFFFFQAEDGIRDLYVTGVQTCALPIFGQCVYGGSEILWMFSTRSPHCAHWYSYNGIVEAPLGISEQPLSRRDSAQRSAEGCVRGTSLACEFSS